MTVSTYLTSARNELQEQGALFSIKASQHLPEPEYHSVVCAVEIK
jgi:hypothetical protein